MGEWEQIAPSAQVRQRGVILIALGIPLAVFGVIAAVNGEAAIGFSSVVLPLLMAAWGWRIRMSGLYVGQRGVRVVMPFTFKTLEWFEIRDFEGRRTPPSRTEMLWVVPKLDPPVVTTVLATDDVLGVLRDRLAARSSGEID